MHRVRQWAHNTAHESRYNPWHATSDTAKPPDQVLTQTTSTAASTSGQLTENGEPDKDKPKVPITRRVWINVKRSIFHSWVNVLLIFVPAGIAVHFAGINPNVVFALNAIAIIPLAGLLTYATENVAHKMGPTLGALMNVSFGNAVELIILIALVKNEIRIVQASLIGSILANLLLILGMAFLIGGLEYREQVYDSTVTQMSACLLALAVLSLLIPTAFHASFNDQGLADKAVLKVSRGTSVILLLTYILYLLFQMKSHAYLYQGTPQHIIDEQSQPGVLARFDSSSTDTSSIASGHSIRSGSSSGGSHRKIRKRLRAKLGRKRHSKTETEIKTEAAAVTGRDMGTAIIEEPMEIVENEKTEDGGMPLAFSPSTSQPMSASDPDLTRQNVTGIAEQEDSDKIADLHASRTRPARPARPQMSTRFTTPEITNQGQIQTEAVPAARRPLAFRALSSFRPPPVFRSDTNPAFISNTRSLPQYQMRRLNSTPIASHSTPYTTPNSQPAQTTKKGSTDSSKESDEPPMSQTASIVLLLCSTGLVALCAEFLVGSIEHLVESSPLSEAFIGLIILPIVGNAAEHVTAVTVAAKNKLDLALGVSLGSSIQIALFVTPIVVILGWIMDKTMSLYFNLFEVASLFVSTFIVNFLVLDGRSNYLEGALLCATYIILAVAAYFFPDGQSQSALAGGSGNGT